MIKVISIGKMDSSLRYVGYLKFDSDGNKLVSVPLNYVDNASLDSFETISVITGSQNPTELSSVKSGDGATFVDIARIPDIPYIIYSGFIDTSRFIPLPGFPSPVAQNFRQTVAEIFNYDRSIVPVSSKYMFVVMINAIGINPDLSPGNPVIQPPMSDAEIYSNFNAAAATHASTAPIQSIPNISHYLEIKTNIIVNGSVPLNIPYDNKHQFPDTALINDIWERYGLAIFKYGSFTFDPEGNGTVTLVDDVTKGDVFTFTKPKPINNETILVGTNVSGQKFPFLFTDFGNYSAFTSFSLPGNFINNNIDIGPSPDPTPGPSPDPTPDDGGTCSAVGGSGCKTGFKCAQKTDGTFACVMKSFIEKYRWWIIGGSITIFVVIIAVTILYSLKHKKKV